MLIWVCQFGLFRAEVFGLFHILFAQNQPQQAHVTVLWDYENTSENKDNQ